LLLTLLLHALKTTAERTVPERKRTNLFFKGKSPLLLNSYCLSYLAFQISGKSLLVIFHFKDSVHVLFYVALNTNFFKNKKPLATHSKKA
jgi:hypothetical protein